MAKIKILGFKTHGKYLMDSKCGVDLIQCPCYNQTMNYKLSGKRFGDITTIIDDEDLEKISNHNWWANTNGRGIRVETDLFIEEQTVWGRKRISMSRYILNLKSRKFVIDHINGNPLDNRKSNLRVCSHKNNIRNRKILNKNNSSGIRGVSWDKTRNRWVAQLMFNKKHIYLGRFENKEDAKMSVVKGLKKYFGKYGEN